MNAPTGVAPLVEIADLEVRFPTSTGDAIVVDGVDLALAEGEFVGLIGETGAGKSMTAWAVMDLVPPPGEITRGSVTFDARRLTGSDESEMRALRGREICMIVQNPRAALNPMLPIGKQVANAYRAHNDVNAADALAKATEALRSVGIPDPDRRARSYPHQLSGGLAQRAMIAMALVNEPRLLIADEPTTGLDVTIQAEILDLLIELVRVRGSAVLLITHDLGIIANYTERASVMFAGQIVESAPTAMLFGGARHPYTIGLISAYRSSDEERSDVDISGPPPDLANPPAGCRFAYRCPWVESECHSAVPPLEELVADHLVRCFVAARRAKEHPG